MPEMANRDSVPPPPYSVTDTLTDAGTPQYTPASSQADDANRVGPGYQPPSAPSSVAEPAIYTPVSSPPESVHHQAGIEDSASLHSTSAAAYFESRPVQNRAPGPPITHSLIVTENTQPQDLPYPEDWVSKNVTQQDWATFINYLLPDHIASVNNDVADRKLKAELIDERMHNLALNDEGHTSKSDISQVDAQLRPLRQSSASSRTESLSAIQTTVAEWNENFFQPRGITIVTSDPSTQTRARDDTPRVPGAWIPYDHELLPSSSSGKPSGNQRGMFDAFKRLPGVQGRSQGFKMGPIIADSEGFRIGNALVAGNNGFRMGNVLVADQKGFRLGGSRGFVADSGGVSMGGRTFGRRESNEQYHDRGHGSEHHRGRGRGRDGYHGGPRRRSVSSSSTSSSSSSSSSDSNSSVGSLPDYDDLQPSQLSVAKRALHGWLNHPEHHITKNEVRQVRQEIKGANKTPAPQSREAQEALRKEVKELMRAFKELKKSRKKSWRESKRERRAIRKSQKKERRYAKREERRARKEGKKKCKSYNGGAPLPQFTPQGPYGPPQMAGHSMSPHHFPSEVPTMARGFPFGPESPVPAGGLSSGSRGPPGMSSMHGAWPFTQGLPYAPGRISVPFGSDPAPVSHGSEQLHAQALQLQTAADKTEAKSVEIRITLLDSKLGEKERLKMMEEAITLEEETDNCRREADRLTAEATLLDSELARELGEEGSNIGQTSGVVLH